MFRLLLILAFVPGLALADLGDTRELAQIKYGEPSATGSAQILTYLHGEKYRVWQIYEDKRVCVVAEFRLVNNAPLTPGDCKELDRANLPGLVTGSGPGWVRTQWPDNSTDRDTVSWQYTGDDGTTYYQVIACQSRDDNMGWYFYRVYLSGAGIEAIKSLQGGR